MLRKIIHIDMDAFFASVEQRDNPELRGKPVAVGHSSKRGVVAAASYEARKYGVHSAMPSVQASRLCPHLIFVPGRMHIYKEVSKQVHEIFREYTDLIEPLSIDEAFLDVTENNKEIPLGVTIAREIKEKIKEQLQLTASAGVSYNKFLAKIASDIRKPDGLCTIHPEQALDFISDLPIESFWGVGPVTAKKMHRLGIHTGLDLRETSLQTLIRHFGKSGQLYYDFSRGVDLRPVESERVRKSVGCENTLEKDLKRKSSFIIELYHVATELVVRLEKSEFRGNTLTLKIKFNDFSQVTRSQTLEHPIYKLKEILALAKKLFQTIEEKRPIRLIGLSVSNPVQQKEEQGEVWEQLSFDFSDWD
ncbi:MAG: DNA polymerase IV [Bacteroides sp.]|nr:DNA polymerase IV [Bacteroides sp.]MDD2645055.1 DNA polymerase IV [Bacteroides sp.]MDD4054764.1 DNA polymerase IV [Bacteroides sp.]MDD4719660.1 DNA polymerase IV [Bacteroides sp.]NLI64052.1 DNA polymerase IV [Bacteroidales bacterium]